jgi:hypothetical protein
MILFLEASIVIVGIYYAAGDHLTSPRRRGRRTDSMRRE